MRLTRLAPAVVLLVIIGGTVTGCSSDQPAVCDDLDSVQRSVDHLKDVQISESGLTAMGTELRQLQQDLQQLSKDAQAEFGDEVDKVQSSVNTVRSSVTDARATPTISTLSAVGASIRSVQTNFNTLVDALADTC